MRIKKMTATFGKLEGQTLTLEPGLNLLEAPNESGKSTWCAFLRAMLYGIPTRERDTKTTLAEKNRFAPWSGAPMAGEVDITWKGRDITLRRFQKGSTPFGGFEAVDTRTGAPVPELTAEHCGETLLGVGREVFQRSAFVGQSGMGVDADPELEKRIAALVSSGEEDVSYSQVEATLKNWRNRRKYNKSGLIPKLEAEGADLREKLARLRENERRLSEAEAQKTALEARKKALEAESAAQKARQNWALREQYRGAVEELERARAALAQLEQESGPLPPKETLREAQGQMEYLKTLEANLKEARGQVEPARAAVDRAEAAGADPVFPDMDADQAWRKANEDALRVRELRAPGSKRALVFGALWCVVSALSLWAGLLRPEYWLTFVTAALALAVGVRWFLSHRKAGQARTAERDALLSRYGAACPDDILSRANAYRDKCVAASEARARARLVEQSVRDLTVQRDALWDRLLTFAAGFAPSVSDPFGVSAALSRALSLDERIATARVKVEGAQKLVSSLPYPGEGEDLGRAQTPPPPTERTPVETAAALAAVQAELRRVEDELSRARGERSILGDAAALESMQDALDQELARRTEELSALELALDTLREANSDLQARFSPELNRRAGEIFSALTGGKYEGVALTREFEANVRERGEVLPRRALTLSQGTVDQLYLAVRLAVCEMALPSEDPAPLVLDDALSAFDDARMALALDYLKGLDRQVLLFTCQSREGAYLGT